MSKTQLAEQYFNEGYNCAQAVFASFCDETGLDKNTAMIYSSGFGGGVGRMREVCGAVTGMVMVINILYGSDNPKSKSDIYKRVQEVSNKFKEQNKSIICKELLGLVPSDNIKPDIKKRPCSLLVTDCVKILEEYIEQNPV